MVAIERTQQRINEQIRISPIRVVAADGALLGILNTDEALAKAREADLDLVEVAPNERPPVCRIMDYGKFKYQQKKKQNRTHTHQSKLKEIRVRPKTGEHDILVKVTQARAFLTHKDKVVVSVIFRGRELAHIEEGRKVIDSRHPAIARHRQGRGVAVAARQTDRLHPGSQVTAAGRCTAAVERWDCGPPSTHRPRKREYCATVARCLSPIVSTPACRAHRGRQPKRPFPLAFQPAAAARFRPLSAACRSVVATPRRHASILHSTPLPTPVEGSIMAGSVCSPPGARDPPPHV